MTCDPFELHSANIKWILQEWKVDGTFLTSPRKARVIPGDCFQLFIASSYKVNLSLVFFTISAMPIIISTKFMGKISALCLSFLFHLPNSTLYTTNNNHHTFSKTRYYTAHFYIWSILLRVPYAKLIQCMKGRNYFQYLLFLISRF